MGALPMGALHMGALHMGALGPRLRQFNDQHTALANGFDCLGTHYSGAQAARPGR